MSIAGKLFIASCFKLSIALVYFSVLFSPLCPNRLANVFMLAPLFSMFTAKECRKQWNRTHKAAVGKQVTIKRNPFEMSGFALFCRMPETQRSAEY